MNPRPRYADGTRWLLAFAVLAALSVFLRPSIALAQANFELRFSSKSGDPAPRASMPLRPNLAQDFYLYVHNLQNQNAMVKVVIQADGKAIEGGTATVPLEVGQKFTQVHFGKKAEPAEKPAVPPAPPAPPALAEVKGPLTLMLYDMTDKPLLIQPLSLNIAQPNKYVEVSKISYLPNPGAGKKNQLRVELKAGATTFAGPRCRVDLVLNPKRIPGLIDTKKFGTRGGYLEEAGSELVLTADNLEFKDNKEAVSFVYLTIDGWERAYTFTTSFPREGGEDTPGLVNSPVVRLLAPFQANPGQPLKVTLEADNLKEQVLELGIDRDGDGKFSKVNGEILDFPGNRQVKMFFNPAYPGGALQLKPEVKDWATELELGEVFGPRELRVRLVQNAAEAAKLKDEDRALDPDLNKALTGGTAEMELRQTVVLDATPPEGVKFVNVPAKLPRGAELPVSAICAEPKTIKEVVFFVGKLDREGKIPPTAVQVPGQLTDKEKGIWSAALDAPTDQKGKFDVSVQFVKVTGLVSTDTIKIELVEPGKETGGGKASIEGKLTDVAGAPQGAGIPVELHDDKGNVKDTTKTDDKSVYRFKDVIPGTYRVTAVRTGTRTSGGITVQVKEGEKKTDVDVKLSR